MAMKRQSNARVISGPKTASKTVKVGTSPGPAAKRVTPKMSRVTKGGKPC